jgi:predicted dehydrogenase
LLADPEVEAIVAPVPNPVHEEVVAACASAGKPVLVEKPLANTVAEGLQMIAACRKAGVVLAVGHNTRRDAVVRQLKESLDDGRLGAVGTFDAQFNGAKARNLSGAMWRYHRTRCPALPLNMLGSHMIDALVYLLGPVRTVTALFDDKSSPTDNDDTCSLVLRMESGVVGTLTASYISSSTKYVRLHGYEAIAEASFWPRHYTITHPGPDGQGEQIPCVPPVNDTLREQVADFARAVRGESEYEVSPDVALHTVAILEAAIRSADEQRAVPVAEIVEQAKAAV